MTRGKRWVLAVLMVGAIGTTGCSEPGPQQPALTQTPPTPPHQQQLSGYITPEVAAAPIVGRVPPETVLTLGFGLPVRDRSALRAAVNKVSDPKSPSFRHYLSPTQFGEQFGASASDYQALVDWAQANHFTVQVHPNRFTLITKATVRDIESALSVRLNYALRPDGTQFYEPDREPSLDLSVAVESIDNLVNYELPRPAYVSNGSGPAGQLTGTNLRAAYAGCASDTLNGTGQTIGIWNPNAYCFQASDINTYISSNDLTALAGGPLPSIESIGVGNNGVCLDGGVSDVDGGGGGRVNELTLDLEMAMTLAPAAQIVMVYVGGNDNMLGEFAYYPAWAQISASYYGVKIDSTGENLVGELALQGQSQVVCTDDFGAYSASNNPEKSQSYLGEQGVTMVGGTELTMSDAGPDGSKVYGGEIGWNGSGGGPLSNPDGGSLGPMQIPPYQLPLVSGGSGGSTSVRNAPDISMGADRMPQVQNGSDSPGNGTSFAAPLFASFLALANQQATNNGNAPIGFVNPALYYIADESGWGTYLTDIVSGSNQTNCNGHSPCYQNTYDAVTGYDLVTGLGSPRCPLIDYLAVIQGSPWTVETNSSLSCVTEIAGGGTAVEAWAISCAYYGDGPDYTIYYLPSLGADWVEVGGGAIHVAVTPSGVPWVLNTNGTAFQLEDSGTPCTSWSSGSCDTWQPMNTYGGSGPHNHLSSIAPGASSTAWATSKTAYEGGSDYTVYYYDGGANGEGTWTQESGGLRQVSNGAYVMGHNYDGTSFVYLGAPGEGSWYALDIATTDYDYEGSPSTYTGQASWIAAGANATQSAYGWIITNNAWTYDSSDNMILQLVQSNTNANNVWMHLPGGATRISVSPSSGAPWVTNAEGVGFIGFYPQ